MQKHHHNFIPQEYDKPKFFETNEYSYLTQMGSRTYGANNEDSDYDFYGFIVPPAQVIFPHLTGHINGFGRRFTPFEQYQIQHVQHPDFGEIDLTVYNIVKYFQLVMEGNPNMVDSLFTHDEDVLHCDEVAELVRENRNIFLSEKMFHTFRGMAHSHMARLKSGKTKEGRLELSSKYGYDTKDGYHAMRMMLQVTDVLKTGELNLKAHSDYLLSIRAGDVPLTRLVNIFDTMMAEVETLVASGKSVVPYAPDEEQIKELLVNCLELKYGSLMKYSYEYMLGAK